MSDKESELTKALRTSIPESGFLCETCGKWVTVAIQEVGPLEITYYHPGRVTAKIRLDHADRVVPLLVDLSRLGVKGTRARLRGIAEDPSFWFCR